MCQDQTQGYLTIIYVFFTLFLFSILYADKLNREIKNF